MIIFASGGVVAEGGLEVVVWSSCSAARFPAFLPYPPASPLSTSPVGRHLRQRRIPTGKSRVCSLLGHKRIRYGIVPFLSLACLGTAKVGLPLHL